jgi:hypothetical protein
MKVIRGVFPPFPEAARRQHLCGNRQFQRERFHAALAGRPAVAGRVIGIVTTMSDTSLSVDARLRRLH